VPLDIGGGAATDLVELLLHAWARELEQHVTALRARLDRADLEQELC
jgi:hypothetical protein